MTNPLRRILMASVTAAFVLTPVAVIVTFASADAVYAKNGNGNGGGNSGNGGKGGGSDNAGNRGKPDHAGNGNRGRNADRATGRNGGGLLKILRGKPERRASGSRQRPTAVRTTTKRRPPVTEVVKVSPVPKVRPEKLHAPAIQSELKWLNAANASLNAYANASPNSRVGQIAAYREALLNYQDAAADPEYLDEIDGYQATLGDFAPEGTTDAELEAALAEIQALDASGDVDPGALEDILSDLNPDATDQEIEEVSADLEAAIASDNEMLELAEAQELALEVAADGIELEPGSEAWDHFHELLRLDEELPETNKAAKTEGADEEDADPVEEDADVVLLDD